MASFFTVIQFVPDPVADERVNAGVVVCGDGKCHVRFVENWKRLQRFGNKDVRFLRDFAGEFEERLRVSTDRPQIDVEALRAMAATWKNAIQFTEPRGSLLSVDQLLKDVERRYLANDRPPETRPFTRRTLKKIAFESARLAFVQHGGQEAVELVKRDFSVPGLVEAHPFSLAIANGRPLVAAEVFSFVGSDSRAQDKDVRAAAWAFEDVKKQREPINLAALVVTGDEPSQAFHDAERIFESLGVEVVPRQMIDEWAEATAERVLETPE